MRFFIENVAVSLLNIFGSLIIGAILLYVMMRIKKRHISKLLGNSKTCHISISSYYMEGGIGYVEYVFKEDMKLQSMIINDFTQLGFLCKDMPQVSIGHQISHEKCEVHIGGPAVNRYTNEYICHHFQNFKWNITQEKLDNYRKHHQFLSIDESFIKIGVDAKGFLLCDSDYLPNDQITDYAILVKIPPTDFKFNPRTVHLLFGGNEMGTKAAVHYFLNNYKELNKRGSRYFIALKCNTKTKNVDDSIPAIDYTSKMFKKYRN